MIDSQLLYYLIVFSETGSLLKASELLHISQPSLSKAMQKLERELDLAVFDRTGNKITLNDDGKEILYYAKDIMMMINKLEAKAKDLKEKTQSINIGLTAPGPMFKFPSLFAPGGMNKKISVSTEGEKDLLKNLLNNVYDIIFINNSIHADNLICKKIMTEHLYVSVPKTHFLYQYKDNIHFSDIDGQTFLLSSDIGCWTAVLDKNMNRSRFLKQSDPGELKEIAEYSSIPSFVTNISISTSSIHNRINIPIVDEDAYMDFYAVCKKEKLRLFDFLAQK